VNVETSVRGSRKILRFDGKELSESDAGEGEDAEE
jgi:hypothetical protein